MRESWGHAVQISSSELGVEKVTILCHNFDEFLAVHYVTLSSLSLLSLHYLLHCVLPWVNFLCVCFVCRYACVSSVFHNVFLCDCVSVYPPFACLSIQQVNHHFFLSFRIADMKLIYRPPCLMPTSHHIEEIFFITGNSLPLIFVCSVNFSSILFS